MEQENVFTAVLNRAKAMGALIPVEQSAMDLGIQIVVKSILFDSVKTIVGFEVIEEIPQGYMPARASLFDYENNVNYALIGIKTIESRDPFPAFMEFEPVRDISKILTLECDANKGIIKNKITTPYINVHRLSSTTFL